MTKIDSESTPMDLAAVQADDALLDGLDRCIECGEPLRYVPGVGLVGEGGVCRHPMDPNDEPGLHVADAELSRVLVAWRRDVDTEPIGELVDTDTALAAVQAARKSKWDWRPMVGPVVAVLAVLVIAVAGLGLASRTAQPGDLLWPVHELLYTTDGE